MNYGAWPTAGWGTTWGAVPAAFTGVTPAAWGGIAPWGLGGLGGGLGGFGGLGGLGAFGIGGYPATTFGSTFGVVPVTSVGLTPYPGVI